MKSPSILLAALAVSAFTFSPLALHAQDDQGGGPPPPPMDQGAPPPPDQQGGPPPPDGQGAPPDGQGAPADQGASFDEFYNNLSNDGQWIQTQDYGYAFQPAVQDPNWAPYTDGHWVYTAYGWTWASDEPWGWATYHYGRWVNIDGTGWVWIPGHQWAPAWVSWRYGGGYCGWAPLPPSTFVGVEFGDGINFDFHFGSDCDTAYGIGPGWYNFIAIGYIGDPGYRGHYYDRNRNFVIINNTRNITNININRNARGTFGAVNVGGPNFAEVNRQSHTPVQQVRLAQAGQAGRSTLSNGTLNVFAPRINGTATAHQGRPATVARTLSNVQINRGTSISHPMQVTSQLRATAPSASAITAAREAEAHAPKGVATSTRVAPTVSAAAVQQERTQSVQRQASQLHNAGTSNAATTQTHTTGGGSQEHPFTGTPNAGNGGNTQAEHNNAQVEHQQQEREAASQQQQQHEQALRQQQQSSAQQQQREEAVRQQQVQQQQHTATQQQPVFHQQQQPQVQQQHESSPFTQQHSSAQPQEQHQAVVPQQQHASGGGNSGGGNSGGGNHSSGGGGGGNSGGNHSSGGGGNHSSGGNNNNNNNNGPGH